MFVLRNRFLNTASFLSGPNDKPGEGGAAGDDQNNDNGGGDGTNDAGAGEGGSDAVGQGDQDAGDGGDGGEGDGGDDDSGDDDGSDGSDDEEDDELAGLTPEQRKKVEARIAKETRWRDKQLDKLYAKTRSAQEDVRAAATITKKTGESENLTAEQIEARARELAGQMSAQEKYDADANAAHAAGVAAYGDKWNSTLAKLPKLGGIDVTDMVDVLATDHPEVVLYSLSDPDTYERVMSLPPAKRRTEIIKLGMKAPPKSKKADRDEAPEDKRPGDQPPPPRTLKNGGRQTAAQTPDLYKDNVSDDAWYRQRNATRRKKFSNVE